MVCKCAPLSIIHPPPPRPPYSTGDGAQDLEQAGWALCHRRTPRCVSTFFPQHGSDSFLDSPSLLPFPSVIWSCLFSHSTLILVVLNMPGLVTDIHLCCVSVLHCSDGAFAFSPSCPSLLGARCNVLGEELRKSASGTKGWDVEGGKFSVVLWLDLSLLVSLWLGASQFSPVGTWVSPSPGPQSDKPAVVSVPENFLFACLACSRPWVQSPAYTYVPPKEIFCWSYIIQGYR